MHGDEIDGDSTLNRAYSSAGSAEKFRRSRWQPTPASAAENLVRCERGPGKDRQACGCGPGPVLSVMNARAATLRLIATLALSVAFGSVGAADFRVVGTDLLGLDFSKAFYAAAGREGVTLALALDGSRTGLTQLMSGRADLAVLTLSSEDAPDAAVYATVPIAWHTVAVVVPSATPLAQVTLAQLAAVFGADEPVTYNRWGDLGLTGEWAGTPITPLAPAVGRGLASELFRHIVLRDRALHSLVSRYASAADVALRLAGDSRAIALAATLPARAAWLKLLPVAVRAGEPAFFPTPENLHSGDYPLRLSLCIVFRRDATTKLLPLLRWLLGDDAAGGLARVEIVPEPATVRRQQLFAMEKE